MKSTNNEQTKGQKEETKETDAIKQYNIGTLKMYVSPQIIETNKTGDFKKKKLNKIYYVRKFTETPSELQQSQRLNAPPAAQPMARPIGQPGAAAAGPPQAAAQPVAAQRQPEPMANTNLVPKVGGLFGSNSINSPDTPSSPTSPNNYNQQPSGSDNILSPNSRNSSGENITNKANYDAEPFISSVIKFTNSGFPSNSSIKSRIDTFFNIKLFRAYLKKLGSPITLYDTKNKTILPKDVPFLNNDVEPNSATTSEKKIASDATGEIVIKTANNEPTFIGSVYAFLFTKPTDQESRQQSDTSKTKTAKPSMLMIKEGDEYRLLGKKIDNAEKTISALGTFSQNTLSKVTKDETISKAITDEFTKKTGTTFPGTVSGTARTLLYTPKSLSPTPPTIDTKVEDLKAIINAGQVDTSRLNSIIQSSRSKASFESGDLVLVPIIDIYNVVMGNVSAKQLEGKISISPGQKNILKLTIELLQKQNVIPTLTGEQKKGANDLYDTKKRNDELLKLLSQETINEINSTIKHNIKFILNLLFSNKTAFIYMGNKYMIDYVDWDSTFKQLQKGAIQKYMMVGYYIDIEIFLEKLELGKLPIDREGTFLGSCTVKKARLNSSWKKDFLDQDWGKVADNFRNAFKPTTPFSITDIIPDVIKKTLRASMDLMEPLNAGVNQISFVQYSFLGQDQLIEAFKLIDNSYAGVSWKNNQSWEKRKERLFTGMDNCNADVYCFQNIQCSMNVYKKIVSALTPNQQSTLTSTDNTVQSDRVRIYNNFVIEKLLDDDKDSTNHVAQIYKRYKNLYHFVYFFEQKCIPDTPTSPTSTLVPDMDFPYKTYPTAVGNLTMVKIDKFEIREKFDIRMAPILNSRSGDSSSIKVLKPLWAIDKSFATITYCYFKGTGAGAGAGAGTGASIIPPASNAPGISGMPVAAPTSGVSSSRTLPGIPEFNVPTTLNDPNDDKLIEAEEQEKKAQQDTSNMVNDENENEGEDEGEDESNADNAAGTGTGPSKVQGVQGGGADPEEQDKPDEWYKNDDSENVGFGNVLNSSKNKSNTKQKAPPKQCEKLFDVQYVPSGQIFGIINIKLDAKKTLKQASSITPPISPMITKEEIEVLLIAAFIFRFRIRYLLSGHTDKNPVFFSGDFNFNETTKERAPATELLLLRSNAFKDFVAAFTAKYKTYGTSIIQFIKDSTILNYLYGGLTKRGRFNLTPKIYGSVSPLSSKDADGDFESAKSNQLIFKTRTLEFCPEEKMNILQSQEHKNGFPDFPNDVDPSNSNAIGGIFNVSTQAVTQQISAVKTAIAQQKNAANSGDIRSIISTMPDVSDDDDEEDFLPSISEKQGFSKVMSSSPAATLHPDVIRDGNDTTYSKENSFFESPYPELVHICPTGDTDFNYLTITNMNEWNKPENVSNVFSDHAPIKFVIDSTPDPSTGKHKCSAGGGGVQGGGGMEEMEEMEEMEGGGENDIKLISWNIANQCIKTNGGFYNHKFDCESDVACVESDAQYLQRLSNIAGAIKTMMGDDSFDNVLVQEGPTTADKVTEFTNYVTTSNEFKIITSDIGTSQYSQFYLVIRQADNDTYLNSGLISNKAGKIFSSNNIAKQIYDNIVRKIQTVTYTVNDIDKDFSKIWFFINQTKKIIMITVHFPFPPNASAIKLMSQRQEQLYIFMNAIITAIRTSTDPQIARYRDFDIIFAGDFNINMLQKFPSTTTPTFLKCGRVPGQETLIYTNNENGPSSFGGQNDAEYNPTNIDFAIYYPKVTVKVVPKVSSQPAVVNRFGQQGVLPSSPSSLPRGSSSPSSPSSPISSSSSSSSPISSSSSSPSRVVVSSSGTLTPPNPALVNIDSKIEQAIFKSSKDAATRDNLQQNVSIIGTEYIPRYSTRDIMPPGSATVINISSTPIYNISYDSNTSTATTRSQSNCKVDYMIQASPAISGKSAELISTDTVTNSVMNSLILAGQKQVENVIIPFIGGAIFFGALQTIMKNKSITYERTDHAKTLVKGVVKYFTFIAGTQTTIKNIIFSPFGSTEVDAISAAILENNKSFPSSRNVTNSDGTKNIIAETISRFTGNKQINAIVNAANVELAFGDGISSMCNAAINGNTNAKNDLTEIKGQFIDAYNQYIKTPVTLPIPTKPTGAGTSAVRMPTPTPTPSSIPCGHIMCKEFNDKVKTGTYTIGQTGVSSGVHTVMLYNTPNDPTIKYWALLGKEHGGSSATTMNTIGGKIDHKYKGQSNFYCIIDNLIKEIGEEAKINLTLEQFNEIFKKNNDPNATSLADYFIYLRGSTTKGPTYIFYGIMGTYADRQVLKEDIKRINYNVVSAYSNTQLPSAQREMFYLNLINFDYNAYSANSGNYSDGNFTVANPPVLQDSEFLLSTAELKNNHKNIVTANKYSSGIADGHDFISFYAAGNMNTRTVPFVTTIFNELKQKQNGPKLPTVVPFVAPSLSPLTSSLASSSKAPVKASGIVACPGQNTVRLPTSIGATATINNFINAQDGFSDYIKSPVNYQTALAEIKSGRKTGHWIWYIIPSDTRFSSSDNSKFYGIGPNATKYSAGNKVITTSEYLANTTLRCRYVEILTEIGKRLIDYNAQIGVYGLTDLRSKQFLINLMGGGVLNEVDYDKLTNSVHNFYNDLVRLGYGGNVAINKLHETLNYFYSNPRSVISPPLAKAPVAAPAPLQARIMDLVNIQSMIRAGKDNSIFLINGGSFNPPHNGHLKIFELAYNFLQNIPKYKGKKIYGIMVASTSLYIGTKGGMVGKPPSHIISNDERIKLCKLAADSYQWGNPNFNQNNIIIYNQAEVNPTGTIIRPLQREGINNMFYLGGSDYYLSSYSEKSDYNIIYVMRAEDKGKSFAKRTNGKDQFPITPPPGDEKEVGLSSTVIRDQIVSLTRLTGAQLQGVQNTIFREVGRGVYCQLQKMSYIQKSELYGNLCSGGAAALPTSSKVSIPVMAPSSSSSSSSYPFFSVPIQNPDVYCYQAAAFQLLFSINSIRTQARVYAEDVGSIAGNACAVLNQMVINRAASNHLVVNKKINQDFLATSAIRGGRVSTQQDSQEFLLSLLNSLLSIDEQIKDEITFLEATYTFCRNFTGDSNYNMTTIRVDCSEFEKTLLGSNITTYQTRKDRMSIPENSYNKFGTLIGVNDIHENKMFECPANTDTINSTIQQILNDYFSTLDSRSIVGVLTAGSKQCPIMTQKEFIKIPDPLKYICFYKRLLPQPNTNYTFATCNGLTINGIQFRLRGYISHFGNQKYGDIKFNDVQPQANSGHYVYVGIENDRQVLYNDGSQPQPLADSNSEYITKGYVFLYERVGGSSGRVGAGAAHGGNKTKKYKKSSTFVVRSKTRKGVMRESSSPKNKNKNVTHHFKIVRNGNNTRKQNKSKSKNKSKNLSIKLK